MTRVRDTLHVFIEYFDGQGDEDNSQPYYVASCVEIPGVTDGATWHELLHNINDMIVLLLEGEDTIAIYNVIPKPRIVISMELPENYAEIA